MSESRAWELSAFGLERLALVDRPMPTPGSGEALVRTRAVSLNARDRMVIDGAYDPRQKLPHVPCSDVAGEVVAIGPGVTRVKPGDRVVCAFAPTWIGGRASPSRLRNALGAGMPGVLATHVALPAEGLVQVPDAIDWLSAATFPCAATTAWHALVDHGQLRAGESVLLQGTGGVSIFGLQIARMHGARAFVTSSSAAKRARLENELGATATLDYRADAEWGKTARGLSGGGVDHVVEVGGAGTLTQSLRAIAPGGSIYVIGVLGGATERFDVRPVLMNEVRLQGVMVGPRDSLEQCLRAFAASGTKPVIDRVFPFERAPDAFAYLASGGHVGKVCLEVG